VTSPAVTGRRPEAKAPGGGGARRADLVRAAAKKSFPAGLQNAVRGPCYNSRFAEPRALLRRRLPGGVGGCIFPDAADEQR
jgi:hypothetical protein